MRGRRARHHKRLALGLTPSVMPGVLLLLLGAALGPEGISLLSPAILSFLDPAVPVALAALGVLVGLGFSLGRSRETRLLAAASVEAAVTVTVVACGTLFILPAAMTSAQTPA